MDQERHAGRSQRRHDFTQVGFTGARKLVDSGMAEKGLEAENAAGDERRDVRSVTRNHTGVEAAIDPKLAAHRFQLLLERLCRCCDRRAVERHVNQGGHAAGRGSPRGGFGNLPNPYGRAH